MDILVTEAARRQIEHLAPDGRDIRLGLRGGGCDGLSYVLEWTDRQPERHDHVIAVGKTNILVDPKSMTLLRGTTLDFERGMMGHGFKFQNPNVKGACGCGQSVQF